MNDREKQTAQDRWPRQQGASRATGTFYASNPTSSSMVGLVRKDQALYSKDYCAERKHATCHDTQWQTIHFPGQIFDGWRILAYESEAKVPGFDIFASWIQAVGVPLVKTFAC